VIIRATSRRGNFWWTTIAGPRGTFAAGLPPQLCFYLPATIRAYANRGGVSNSLQLLVLGCLTF
jgi:hypothetical protein